MPQKIDAYVHEKYRARPGTSRFEHNKKQALETTFQECGA